jgi:hypothetical protein
VKQELLTLLTEGSVKVYGRTPYDALSDHPRQIPPELIEAADIAWKRNKIRIGDATFLGCHVDCPTPKTTNKGGRPHGSALKTAGQHVLALAEAEGIDLTTASKRIAKESPWIKDRPGRPAWKRIREATNPSKQK